MWILVLMTIANAFIAQASVQNEYRLSFGFVQFGILEGILVIGFLAAVFRGAANRSVLPTPVSPVYPWLMGLMIVGVAFGVFGGLKNDVLPKDILTDCREFGSVALCMFIGYRLLRTPDSARAFAYVSVVAGVITASMLFIGFGENAEKAQLVNNLNPLRGNVTDFNSEYAAVAAVLLIFCLVTNVKFMPRPLLLLVAIFCFVGYLSTLSRTGTLAMAFTLLMCYFVLPKGTRMLKMVKAAAVGVVIGIALIFAMTAADAMVGRDFLGKLGKHFEAMLPREEGSTRATAYDARWSAMQIEIGIWLENPLMGEGFGIQDTRARRMQVYGGAVAFNHNGWTSTLCKTGIVGFAGMFGTIFMMGWFGWRLVHQATDRTDRIIGGLAFIAGCVFFMRASCTMAFTTRAALEFGLVAGVVLRYREMHRAKLAAMAEYDYAAANAYLPDHAGLEPALVQQGVEWGYLPDESGHYNTGHRA